MRFILGFALIFALVSVIAIRVGTTAANDIKETFGELNREIEKALDDVEALR